MLEIFGNASNQSNMLPYYTKSVSANFARTNAKIFGSGFTEYWK